MLRRICAGVAAAFLWMSLSGCATSIDSPGGGRDVDEASFKVRR